MGVAVVFAGLALVIAVAQQDFDNVQITAQHVAGPVHMLEGSGGNPSEYDSWGTGFINTERWLESVYRSVS